MVQAGRRLRAAPGGVRFLAYLTETRLFQGFVLVCIIANALALGVDAQFGERNPWHGLIEQADFVFLMIFTGELALEFMAQGPRRYFASGWNWFDVIVVGLAFLATNPAISALRTLRVVRVFRLISAVPQMRRVVEALLMAMPGIIATLAVLALVFYIGAVMATTLFAGETGFKDLGDSAITLFKVSQFDGWGDTIAQLQPRYPYAWASILAFTVIGSFAVLNLFIGVIVDAVQNARSTADETMKGEVHQVQEDVHAMQSSQDGAALTQKRILDELVALRAEIAALREGRAATE
jgi:voltage-gated sodium channel